MEHRQSIRKALSFKLRIYKHQKHIFDGTSKDLGLGGVFVEADGYAWRKNEQLEVEFVAEDGSCALRLPVIVVHLRNTGAGLMFDVVSSAQHRLLRFWVFGQHSRAANKTNKSVEVA